MHQDESALDLVYVPIDHGSHPSELRPGDGYIGDMYLRWYAEDKNGTRNVTDWRVINTYEFSQLCRGDVVSVIRDRCLFTVHVNKLDWYQLRVREEDSDSVGFHLSISKNFSRIKRAPISNTKEQL